MKERAWWVVAAALVIVSQAAPVGAVMRPEQPFAAKVYMRSHGYLPLRGIAALRRAKAYAAATAARHPGRTSPGPSNGRAPTKGSTWQGVSTSSVSPPDANGAIGPNSYIEVVNQRIGIYRRDDRRITSANLSALTGHVDETDPMVLWDPDTQRFYYSVLNLANARMDWGFSESADPTSIPGSFCTYETSFGYPATSVPDYPKLGQTKDYLLIGVNFYPSPTGASTSSDLLWINKPQGSGPISTCPSAASLGTGKVTGLKSEGGLQAYTPVPSIQTDPSSAGFVLSVSDLECPPCAATSTLTVFTVTPSATNPKVPRVSPPDSIAIGHWSTAQRSREGFDEPARHPGREAHPRRIRVRPTSGRNHGLGRPHRGGRWWQPGALV